MIPIIRRRFTTKEPLPYDEEVEYIYVDEDGAYIDTGIDLDENTLEIRLEFGANDYWSTTYNRMIALTPDTGLNVYSKGLAYFQNENIPNIHFDPYLFYNITTITRYNYREIRHDSDWGYNSTLQKAITNGRIYLFGGPGFHSAYDILFTYFKIYINNVLRRDYIPVRVGTEYGMYDRVSGEVFFNASNTGYFNYP